MEEAKYKAEQIAEWFIARSLEEEELIGIDESDESGEGGITHLKLQKLLYYAQGCYLAIYNKPLFKEAIVAWKYGPVVEEVYNRFKGSDKNPLKLQEDVDITDITALDQGFLEETYQIWGQYSALKLVNMTHEEAPFKETAQGDVIDNERIKAYFIEHHIEDV
jgi:uncharacterized phage-associated protein